MRPRILLADHDPVVLTILGDRFHALGFDVETASDGMEAAERIRRGKLDVAVLDVGMPSLIGFPSTIPVVLLSSEETVPTGSVDEAIDADLRLDKRLGAERIVDSVRRLID
jgi:DNA-binding response OmpR family regulator